MSGMHMSSDLSIAGWLSLDDDSMSSYRNHLGEVCASTREQNTSSRAKIPSLIARLKGGLTREVIREACMLSRVVTEAVESAWYLGLITVGEVKMQVEEHSALVSSVTVEIRRLSGDEKLALDKRREDGEGGLADYQKNMESRQHQLNELISNQPLPQNPTGQEMTAAHMLYAIAAWRLKRAAEELMHERDPLEMTDHHHEVKLSNIADFLETGYQRIASDISVKASSGLYPFISVIPRCVDNLRKVVDELGQILNLPPVSQPSRRREISQGILTDIWLFLIVGKQEVLHRDAGKWGDNSLFILQYPSTDPAFAGYWVSHCLNLDLIGAGTSPNDSLKSLEQIWDRAIKHYMSPNERKPFVAPVRFLRAFFGPKDGDTDRIDLFEQSVEVPFSGQKQSLRTVPISPSKVRPKFPAD
ncbi:MAG: hypothetical protein R3C18_19815 [Planctomycetaceae bacterium]